MPVREDIALPGNKPIEPMEHHNIGDFFVNRIRYRLAFFIHSDSDSNSVSCYKTLNLLKTNRNPAIIWIAGFLSLCFTKIDIL